jgi:hypothetical protein
MTQATTTRESTSIEGRQADGTSPASRLEVARQAIELVTEPDAEAQRAGVERLFAPSFQVFGPARDLCPHHAARALNPIDYRAFEESVMSIQRMNESGDRVIAHVRFEGTHAGTFCGRPGTGRRMSADGLLTLRIVNGQVEEAWSVLRWR